MISKEDILKGYSITENNHYYLAMCCAMEEYATIKTKELQEEVDRLKAELNNIKNK